MDESEWYFYSLIDLFLNKTISGKECRQAIAAFAAGDHAPLKVIVSLHRPLGHETSNEAFLSAFYARLQSNSTRADQLRQVLQDIAQFSTDPPENNRPNLSSQELEGGSFQKGRFIRYKGRIRSGQAELIKVLDNNSRPSADADARTVVMKHPLREALLDRAQMAASIKSLRDEFNRVSPFGPEKNIIWLHDWNEFDGKDCFFLMPYVSEMLTDRICLLHKDRKAASLNDWIGIVSLLKKCCGAIQLAHRSNIAHLDLKPDNIGIMRSKSASSSSRTHLPADDDPIVMDWGLASSLHHDGRTVLADQIEDLASRRGTVNRKTTRARVGTTEYAAPEQLPSQDCSIQTDVFQLGGILYEILTGQSPFKFARQKSPLSTAQILLAAYARPLEHCSWLRNTSLRQLVTIVDTAMQREPCRRYQSAAQLERELDRWIQHVRGRTARRAVRLAGGLLAIIGFLFAYLVFVEQPFSPAVIPNSAERSFDSDDYSLSSPAISPDGRSLLAIRTWHEPRPDGIAEQLVLFHGELDTPNWEDLTSRLPRLKHAVSFPCWAADGRKFAFYSHDSRRVYVVEPQNGTSLDWSTAISRPVAMLECGIEYTGSLRWIDDRRLLATNFEPSETQGETGRKGLFLIDTEQNSPHPPKWIRLDVSTQGIQDGAVSPDGRHLAYTGPEVDFTAGVSIGRMGSTADPHTQLVHASMAVGNLSEKPAWLSNHLLCFASVDDGEYRLSVAACNSFRPWFFRPLWKSYPLPIPNSGSIYQVSAALDEPLIAFTERGPGDRFYSLPAFHDKSECTSRDLVEYKIDQLIKHSRVWEPEWSPSYQRLIFACDKSAPGRDQIFYAGDHGRPISLTTGNCRRYTPRLSPDGQQLLVVKAQGVDTGGGEYVEFTNLPPFHPSSPTFPRNGVGDSTFQPLIANSSTLFHGTFQPNWSADGKQICFAASCPSDSGVTFPKDVLIGIVNAPRGRESIPEQDVRWVRFHGASMEERPAFIENGPWLVCEGSCKGTGWDILLVDTSLAKSRNEIPTNRALYDLPFINLTNDCPNERSPRWVRHNGKDYIYYVKDYSEICRLQLPDRSELGEYDWRSLPRPESVLKLSRNSLSADCFCVTAQSLIVSVRKPQDSVRVARVSFR